MDTFLSNLKKDIVGYVTLILLIWLVFGTGLIALFIYLLFIYLLTDLVTNDLRKYLKFIPASVLLWLLYLLLIGVFLLVSFRIVPSFFADSSRYFDLIWRDAQKLIAALAQRYSLNIDLIMLRNQFLTETAKSFGQIIKIFQNVTKNIIYFIFALVLNFLLYHEKVAIRKIFTSKTGSIMDYIYNFILIRITRFYIYFRKVMGGQVLISLINVFITSVAITFLHLPHKVTLLCLIFIFGLIPVVGNLISNTILTITTLVSAGIIPAVLCLVLLVAIHKLEYFLNGKIVGSITNLPMFITLLAILLGEAFLGIWGILIAIPFVLTIKEDLEMKN